MAAKPHKSCRPQLLPGWVGRPHSKQHSVVQRPSPAQLGGGRHTYVAKRGGCVCGVMIHPEDPEGSSG
jgi:hypothetical protein